MVVLVALLLGFLAGALTTLVAEVVALVLVIRRLNRRVQQEAEQQSAPGISQLQDSSFLPSQYSKDKEGSVWVLEPGKLPKPGPMDKGPGDQKWKKDVIEVTPVRKNAKVKDHSLILTESDGSNRAIQLEGCSIAAVSATSLSSRKWAKRFPIKVESKTSLLYNGSKTMYIYLGTSMEKESWCKALRLASCNDTETEWFSKLCREFQSYLANLNEGHLSLLKPSGFYSGPVDRSVKLDGSSKVRHFLKKFAKKACKSGVESKASWSLASVREGTKINEKFHSPQDSVLGTGVVKTTSIQEAPNLSAEEKIGPSSSTLTPSGSRSHTSVFSDVDSDERICSDEGTLCWNLLASRLFFDAKSNSGIKSIIQARVQRTLSNMRKPSYIGELTCIDIDLGNLPPYVSGMRLLPSDMNEVWAMEFDIQYSGGVVIDVATRLEVSELQYEGRTVDTNLESSPVEEVTSDILEGFEHFGKQLELSEGADGATERMDETNPKEDGVKTYKTTKTGSSSASRWKSIVNSIAKQVSQVPLTLAIKVTSLKGTLRLLIKSPTSDHLWFGFTSMPDIDFNLESSVGEHKINSGRIALLLISRFKAAIRENLVLPNSEGVWIPWMLAEKDDWIPREVAPFIWMNQQSGIDSSQPGEVVTAITDACRQTMSDVQEDGDGKGSNIEGHQQQISESSGPDASLSDPAIQSAWSSKSLQELSVPLLSSDKSISASHGREEDSPNCQSPARSMTLAGEHIQVMEGDDLRPKRVGTRARMLGLGKKMAEKLDEKRRTVEDKGRHIVDRMRGP